MDEALAAGLVMAGVFAWILAFPWFGPLGPAAHGYRGFPWPYVFGFAHGAGFLVFSHPAWRRVFGFSQVFAAGLLIWVLTAAIAFLLLPFWLVFLLFVTVGLAAAYLVVAWSPWFVRLSRPALALVVLMVGSGILLLVVLAAAKKYPEWSAVMATVAGLFVFVAACFLSRAVRVQDKTEDAARAIGPPVGGERDPKALAALAVFAFTGYVIAGLMYRLVYPAAHARWADSRIWGTLLYWLAAGLIAAYTRRRSLPRVSSVTLSTLGVGFLLFTLGRRDPYLLPYSYLLIMAGLGAVDVFYALSLWALAWKYGARRTFGIGLGLKALLTAASGALVDSGLLRNPLQAPGTDIVALVLVLLTIPFVGPNTLAFRQFEPGPDEERLETDEPPAPVVQSPPAGPPAATVPDLAQLTSAESRIFALLLKGHSDLHIAEQLFVSPNTVRFHVRNILRKAGVPNRKELLASMVRSSSHQGREEKGLHRIGQ